MSYVDARYLESCSDQSELRENDDPVQGALGENMVRQGILASSRLPCEKQPERLVSSRSTQLVKEDFCCVVIFPK